MTTAETAAATDVGVFARRVLGRPLWDHQLDLARSPARYRMLCAPCPRCLVPGPCWAQRPAIAPGEHRNAAVSVISSLDNWMHDMAKLAGSECEMILKLTGDVIGDRGFIGTENRG